MASDEIALLDLHHLGIGSRADIYLLRTPQVKAATRRDVH